MHKYIIVKIGAFADGSGPSFQLFEQQRDFNHEWYEPVTHVTNDPTTLSKARERLEELNQEELNDPT